MDTTSMGHESRTERFFSRGVENYGTFHGNYLNFGLWENGIAEYVQAAEHLLSRVAGKIGLQPGSTLLDVACGMGTQGFFFMRKFRPAWIQALDLTRKHIEMARARNTFHNIQYDVGNACALPYAGESFTHLTSIEGPVNFNTRETFFREAYRVLQPGGKVGMSDFSLLRHPHGSLEKGLLATCRRLWHIPTENVYPASTYQQKLEQAGFRHVEIEEVKDAVYPGYYREQKRIRREMYQIRGEIIGRVGLMIDALTYYMYSRGLIGYILVSAQK